MKFLTKKQEELGVTYGTIEGSKETGLLNNYYYFKAWASNLKIGQYNIIDLLTKEGINEYYLEEMKQYFLALSINHPKIFSMSVQSSTINVNM